ncbi:MAG: hypothetical protein HC888_15855 [Candidatus Competibacteraceae bacterium]|nr:hypothetical protein [Candidatus Competibacteraceae bacterium]
MTTVQKLSFSLLIAVLVFSAFAVAAFSGLFTYIESTLFDQRIKIEYRTRLASAAESIRSTNDALFAAFSSVLEDAAVRDSLTNVNPSRETIFRRSNLVGKLLEDTQGLRIVRIVDRELRRTRYSSLDSDVRNAGPTIREFADLSTMEQADTLSDLAKVAAESGRHLLMSRDENQLIYQIPIVDAFGITVGHGLFYVSVRGLAIDLLRVGALDPGETISLSFPDIIIQSAQNLDLPTVKENLRSALGAESPAFQNEKGDRYYLFSEDAGHGLRVAMVVRGDVFVMNAAMKTILLVSVFLTTLLLAFLLFNLRQDPVLVAKERVRKLQVQLVRDYLEGEEDRDWGAAGVLDARKDEVKTQLRKGSAPSPGKRQLKSMPWWTRAGRRSLTFLDARPRWSRSPP